MKKIPFIALAALLFSVAPLTAQSSNAIKLDMPEVSAADPYTTLLIDVAVERETIRKGPYARFTQKYLGAVAPLTDKDIYTLKDARIGDSSQKASEGPASQCCQPSGIDAEFPKVGIDRLSAIEKSLEDQARDAANTIFTLRKRRFDLVSGEAGEYVFGEGLKAAIEELERMENEYLALFMGKQTVTRSVRTFEVIPRNNKTNYIVCRFSAEKGLLPESDLSGTPVVLTLAPENTVPAPVAAKGAREYYRVADFVQCTLAGPFGELARAVIPVYQFGATLPASSVK